MKYLVTILSLLSLNIASIAQNIVPNPSFEEDTSCPDAYSQIYYCNNWTTGNEGTPDYYNKCDSASVYGANFSVPNNCSGYQAAFSGVAYAGIYGYSEITTPDYHEYLMVKIPPLDSGATYHVSVEVSLADSSGYASDGLGMLFNTVGSYPDITTIPVAPQMNFNSFGVISNTTGWTRLSGSFTADSAYTYLIFGVFKDSGQLFKIQIKNPPRFLGFTYYYIDSVIVEKITGSGVAIPPLSVETCIHPNPLFTGAAVLTFNNPSGAPYNAILYNTQGQIVKQWRGIIADEIKIDRNGLPDGLYYYRLENADGKPSYGKLAIGN